MRFGTAFIAIWAALAIITGLLHIFASPKTRRIFGPPVQIVAGVALVGAAVFLDQSRTLVAFAVFGAAILVLSAIAVRICTVCGTTNRNPYFFPAPKFCQKCGHALDARDTARS